MRFWEIDTLRGIAIVLMVIFNWAFALNYFLIYSIGSGWLFWWLFPRFIATMFIVIAGISFTISYSRMKTAKKKTKASVYKKYIFRGGKIFLLGMLATLATGLFFPQGTIYFGILHFLGIAIMTASLFRNLGKWNVLLGIIFILTGIIAQTLTVSYLWLLWAGIKPENFYTFDYFPLFPWLGIFLIGMFAGDIFYKNGKRNFMISDEKKITQAISFLGRHSLVIYILHIPVLLLILHAFGYALF
ncbi:MAG: DUF1624 domain-containing protein [Candidatus Aenigmarchaeota archaeon]|nr:DUF1624 domain-containing protein [Candidatus Aenigmarchaeota archaeon]